VNEKPLSDRVLGVAGGVALLGCACALLFLLLGGGQSPVPERAKSLPVSARVEGLFPEPEVGGWTAAREVQRGPRRSDRPSSSPRARFVE